MATATGAPLPFEVTPPTDDRRAAGLRSDSSLVALGVSLLAAAVVISTIYSRQDGDLDWSNYAVGLAATAGLLVVGLLARMLVKDRVAACNVASWPLAFGAVAAGLMVGVGVDDFDQITYLVGGVITALAVLAYVVAPSAPPALAAVVGLLILYGQVVEDVVTFDAADDNEIITGAIVITVFVLAVTLLGSLLPPARVVVGVTVGAFAVVAFLGLLASLGFAAFFTEGFVDRGGEAFAEQQDNDRDVYVILALAALLVAVWLVLARLTDGAGYRVVALAMVATVVPAAMAVLVVEHPSWWGAGIGGVGGLVLLLAALRARRAHRPSEAYPVPTHHRGYPPTPPGGTPLTPPGGTPGTPPRGTPPPPPPYLGS